MSSTDTGAPGRPPPTVVMIVDDDTVFARVVSRILRERAVTPVVLHRAFGLLNAIAEHRPSLLLLDLMMPGLDGASITTLIRDDPELRG